MVDARGYSCPIPVVMVQRAVKAENPQSLTVLVDEQVCVENVTRFANASGYTVTVTRDGDDFRMELNLRNEPIRCHLPHPSFRVDDG